VRFLIMLEQTESGFAVQAPDLAIVTFGSDIEAAKHAVADAIQVNLEAYRESGQRPPDAEPVAHHLENPEYQGLLFAYIDVPEPKGRVAA